MIRDVQTEIALLPQSSENHQSAPSPGRIFWSQSANIFHSSMGGTWWWVVLEFQPHILVICFRWQDASQTQDTYYILIQLVTPFESVWVIWRHMEVSHHRLKALTDWDCTVCAGCRPTSLVSWNSELPQQTAFLHDFHAQRGVERIQPPDKMKRQTILTKTSSSLLEFCSCLARQQVGANLAICINVSFHSSFPLHPVLPSSQTLFLFLFLSVFFSLFTKQPLPSAYSDHFWPCN
jgi:hypothetical protein